MYREREIVCLLLVCCYCYCCSSVVGCLCVLFMLFIVIVIVVFSPTRSCAERRSGIRASRFGQPRTHDP